MHAETLNSGIIFTKSNCIGCNKCISGCVAVGANVVVTDTRADHHTVQVDPNKCILCGTCVDACVHHARTYRDDTEEFFAALARGEDITILVSPMLLTDYEKQYHNILGYLKHLGVRHVYNTGFGADIMIWVCMNFIGQFGLSGVISQFCPVIVNYLEKYKPELLQNLLPVQSPAMCTAIYVSDYLKNTDKLAFISPCIAKKHEIEDVNTYGKISYNVTFERLMKHLEGVDVTPYHAEDEVGYGLGALISLPGGLSDNVERYIGFDQVLIQTEGPSNIFPYFDHYYKEVSSEGELPFLVDALSCTNGCNFGTGTRCGIELRNEMTFSAHRMKENAYQSGNVSTGLTYEERIEMLNKRFEQFEISSFVRQFDVTRRVPEVQLAESEYEAIYNSMFKYTQAQRFTDCGACGYKTCRAMAYAIGTGVNQKENCINYSKECIRQETEKINNLLLEISKMNEELKQSTQLKSNFLANMSHEIRTPMNAIIGMAEMALRGELPNEERGYIRQIKASGRSLLAIINDILDFSKIESGKMELNESEYKVLSILNDTVNIVMTRIGEKNITLMVDLDPDIPATLYGDDIRIKQILVNLANNAVKFTESGCVEISVQHERAADGIYLSISIRDTGIGIRPDDLDKLFNSFQQVDSKRNRNVEGTGLGLAISREFVRLMNGSIAVESTYGKGSTFSFRIPQRVIEDKPCIRLRSNEELHIASWIGNDYVRENFVKSLASFSNVSHIACSSLVEAEFAYRAGATYFFVDYDHWTPETDQFARTHRQFEVVVILDARKDFISASYVRKLHQPAYALNLAALFNNEPLDGYDSETHAETENFEATEARVLIIDDNTINLTVAKGLLSPLRMDVTGVTSAREAMPLIEENRYDIIFMDHMMPDIDGVEATHMLRAMDDPYYKTVPIIALTANAINNAKEMFLREGMSDFVAKPIEMRDITAKLRRWLPQEKIHNVVKQDVPTVDTADGLFPAIEGLDVHAGLALSGSRELYENVLGDYYAVIQKKSDLIAQYERDGDWHAYTIEVHALKSASRLVGAGELADLAAELEQCGKNEAVDVIRAKTPELLRMYRALQPILLRFSRKQPEPGTVSVTAEELAQKLEALDEAVEDFDIDAAKELMDQLDHCVLDGRAAATRQRLSDAVYAMEYDDASAIAKEWLEDMHKNLMSL